MKTNELIDKLLQVPNQEEEIWIQALTDSGDVIKVKATDIVNGNGKLIIM